MPASSRLVASAATAALLLLAAGVARGEGPGPAGGVAFEPGTPPFATVLGKARAQKKIVFVDFTTEWCGWCKKLDQDTFSKPEVGRAMTGFVCVHVDAEKGEGPELAKRYVVRGFPALVVVDDAGEEIDRIVGYMPPATFVPEIQRIERGERTLKSLRAAVAADPKDLAAALDLATKQLEFDPAAAQRTLRAVPADAKPKDDEQAAKRALLLAQALQESNQASEAIAAYQEVATTWPQTSAAPAAIARGANLALRKGLDAGQEFFAKVRAAAKSEAERARIDAQTFPMQIALAARAMERQGDVAGDDPGTLNNLAWQAFQFRHDRTFARLLPKAIAWARRAVKLSADDPDMLDTLANLLAATGEVDEAISVEERAIAKAADPAMKGELERNVAAWKAARDARPKAPPRPTGAGAVPPPAPATPPPSPPAPQPR